MPPKKKTSVDPNRQEAFLEKIKAAKLPAYLVEDIVALERRSSEIKKRLIDQGLFIENRDGTMNAIAKKYYNIMFTFALIRTSRITSKISMRDMDALIRTTNAALDEFEKTIVDVTPSTTDQPTEEYTRD